MTPDSDLGVITPAELAALQAYLDCGSIKEAAHCLGLTTHTVSFHLAHVRRKTDSRTTAEATFRLRHLLRDRLAA